MLDSDLAELYGVTTKRLNEQVRRNHGRFPIDFMFQLTAEEAAGLRSQIATSKAHRQAIRSLVQAIREFMATPEPRTRAIGFRVEEGRPAYRARRPRRQAAANG